MSYLCKRFYGSAVTTIPSIAPPPGTIYLPTALHLAPGIYSPTSPAVQAFDCTQEGLYVFWDATGGDTERRIMHASDAFAVLSGLSWLCVNGDTDQALSIQAKLQHVMRSKLRSLCGPTVQFSRAICDSVNIAIPNRMVHFLTAETPTNYYDGHVAMEAQVAGNWQAWDIVNGQVPMNAGAILSLKDMFEGPYTLEVVGDSHWAVEPGSYGQFDVTAWQEMTMRTPVEAAAEYTRIFQIPGIDHTDGKIYWYMPPGTESRQSYVEGLSAAYVVIPKAQWLAMFYP